MDCLADVDQGVGAPAARIAIVGGGFAGLSAARRLQQIDPRLEVVILDAARIAEGGTGRNSGFMIDLPHDLTSSDYAGAGEGHDRQLTRLNRHAIDFAAAAVALGIFSFVTVRSITIEGASLIALEELNALLAHHIDQSLTLAELEHAAQTIAEHYRHQGWYARVYLPQQDVTDGSIRIQIIEGRFSGSSVQPTGTRANANAVQALITHRLQAAAPLSSADLERGLLLANDLPGIAATGTLQAGQAQGDTQLAINLQEYYK